MEQDNKQEDCQHCGLPLQQGFCIGCEGTEGADAKKKKEEDDEDEYYERRRERR